MRNQFRSGLMSPPPKVGGYGYEIGSGMNRTMRNQYGRNQGQAPMPNAMPNPASAMEAMPNPNYAPPAPAPTGADMPQGVAAPAPAPQMGGYGFEQGSGMNRAIRDARRMPQAGGMQPPMAQGAPQQPQMGRYGYEQGSGMNSMIRDARRGVQPGQIQDGLGRTGQQPGRVPRWNTSNFRGNQGGY